LILLPVYERRLVVAVDSHRIIQRKMEHVLELKHVDFLGTASVIAMISASVDESTTTDCKWLDQVIGQLARQVASQKVNVQEALSNHKG